MGKVCQTTYQVPESIEDIVRILNESYHGSIELGYEAETIWIYTGDQLIFKADTIAEATALLQGILIAVEYWKPYNTTP